MNKPRVITWVALVTGFILVPLLALALLLPIFIDSETVKSKVRVFVAEKTNGLARIEKIDLVWFPRPGVVIRDAAISFDTDIQGSVQRLILYPSMRHLLTGSLAISSVTADGAAWVVRLAARNNEPFNLDEVEEKIRAAIKGLALNLPGMNLRIRGGAVDIGFSGGRSLLITDIDANLGVTADKLDLAVSTGSNLADRLQLAGEIATMNLASEARLSIENVGLRKIFDFVSPASTGWIDDGAATLTVQLSAVGLKRFSAEISGSLSSLTLARGTRKVLIKANDFKGIVAGDEKAFRVAVEDWPLVSPPLRAAGELIFDRSSSTFSVKLIGRDLDAGMIRESALLLADDVASVQNVFRYLQAGTIPELRVETRGRSFAEAFENKHAAVTANFHSAKVFVPGPDLDLENVGGSLLISAGVLECRECSVTLGKVKGREGALRVGLVSPNGPFHLDITVETDARELHSLLVRHVKDEAFQKELSRIRQVDGSLSGRLVLGETLDAISAKLSAVAPALTVSYEPVPYPISLSRGHLNYEHGRIEAESLEGAIGRSSFSGLTGSLRTDGTGQVNIKSASLQLDLEQGELLLRKVETIHSKLGPENSARGKIYFASISLTGPLDNPSRWDFRGRGKVEGVLVKHALLPAPVSVTHGTFDATHEKLTFADTKVELLDASMSGGGVIEHWHTPPLRVEATANGIAGGRMVEWVRRQTKFPAQFMPRSPLEFFPSRVAWRDDGDFSFNGRFTVANGPQLSIDMTKTLRSLAIKELSIQDGAQSARAKFELDRDHWGLAFSGSVNKQMLERIFLSAPMPIGLLQGDFAVEAFSKPPFRLSARGTLAAKNLVPPVKGEGAVIEQIIVQGDTTGLNIRSADLHWRRSHISVSGKLASSEEALQVDMDVSADQVVWEEFSEAISTGAGQKEQGSAKVALPALEGVIRFKADRFVFGALSWIPLQMTAQLTAYGITGVVENGVVCGIRTAGRFSVQKNDQIDLDVRLSVKDGELDATSRCLSSERSDISGTYSLAAHLTGGDSRERLASTLSGEFDFVARDGKFFRSAELDATFDYLNDTGDFNVAFPDLSREAIPYRFISAKGTVERQSVFAKELIIEASPYTITAQGTADLAQKTIDGKGLVTVLLPADKLIKSIPLVGSIVSGSMVGIPIEVTGAFEQPRVSYLSPASLGAEIVNLPVRILKVPLEALQIFTPRE
jgi:hypothetical protein